MQNVIQSSLYIMVLQSEEKKKKKEIIKDTIAITIYETLLSSVLEMSKVFNT